MYSKAKEIVEKITSKGFIAYYAGGWVRDYLLGVDSYDIDIATNATPDIIKSLFEHTVPIGEAFGIILVIIDEHSFEIATFRKDLEYKDGRRPSTIEYTTAREDALRRDFTINGMYFDPFDEKVIDYVDGQKDLKSKIIRAIGDPNLRFKEDRLRMIRAIRISCRFDFEIEENTKKAILYHAKNLFPSVAIERIYQELMKMSKYDNFKNGLISLFEMGLLQEIFEDLKNIDIEVLKNRLIHLSSLPTDTPTVIKLLELFSYKDLEQKINFCKYLKLSNEDTDFIKQYHLIQKAILEENPTDFDLAHLMKSSDFDLILKIIASHMPINKREDLITFYQGKKAALRPCIERIKNKCPLITSKDLIALGVKPGPKMGAFLKTAEIISINEKIENKASLLQKIKKLL